MIFLNIKISLVQYEVRYKNLEYYLLIYNIVKLYTPNSYYY